MDVDVAKTSTQPTISPRKEVKEAVKTPEKITPSGSSKRKSSASPPPRSVGKRQKKDIVKTPELASKSKSVPKTPMVNTPAKGATPKITTPKDAILESPKKNVTTPKEKRLNSVKTPMVGTPAKGETPSITTPKDAILESPKKDVTTPKEKRRKSVKTPMVGTPAKGKTPSITTPKDIILESPKAVKAKTPKTPASVTKVRTPRANAGVNPKYGVKTPKSLVKKVGRTPKQSSLYSEIVKKNLGKSTKKVKVARVAEGKVTKVKKTTKVVVKTPKKTEAKPRSTTGHANSPENIVIGNKKEALKRIKTPKSVKAVAKTPKSISTKTPKTGKTPRESVVKKLGGRTPAKRTLWSEVVKKNLGRTPNKGKKTLAVAATKTGVKKPVKIKKVVKESKDVEQIKSSSVSSTGKILAQAQPLHKVIITNY